jgi:hypothetical protein
MPYARHAQNVETANHFIKQKITKEYYYDENHDNFLICIF